MLLVLVAVCLLLMFWQLIKGESLIHSVCCTGFPGLRSSAWFSRSIFAPTSAVCLHERDRDLQAQEERPGFCELCCCRCLVWLGIRNGGWDLQPLFAAKQRFTGQEDGKLSKYWTNATR